MAQIDLSSVSVEYPVFNGNARSLKKHFLKVATGGNIVKEANTHVIIKGLDNITLSINHGDRIGLIGPNGAGKSTLLRLLANIYEPTSGRMKVEGHVSPMLDLATGMEAEFTGYENIYTRGILLGLTGDEINKQCEHIAEQTGLGEYLTMPVRTYSAGMKMRLAFSISTSIKPDILLLDEIFSAGDSEFIQIARDKMMSLVDQSSIVVMATHDDKTIQECCTKALLLEKGQLKYFGPVDKAFEVYYSKESN